MTGGKTAELDAMLRAHHLPPNRPASGLERVLSPAYTDLVDDLFPGSGYVTSEITQGTLL